MDVLVTSVLLPVFQVLGEKKNICIDWWGDGRKHSQVMHDHYTCETQSSPWRCITGLADTAFNHLEDGYMKMKHITRFSPRGNRNNKHCMCLMNGRRSSALQVHSKCRLGKLGCGRCEEIRGSWSPKEILEDVLERGSIKKRAKALSSLFHHQGITDENCLDYNYDYRHISIDLLITFR